MDSWGSPSTRAARSILCKKGDVCVDSQGRLNDQPPVLAAPQKREYLFPVLSLPWFPAWAGGTARTAGCICSCICTAQPLLQPQTPQQQDKGVSHPRAVLSVLQSQKPGAGIATELWNHSSAAQSANVTASAHPGLLLGSLQSVGSSLCCANPKAMAFLRPASPSLLVTAQTSTGTRPRSKAPVVNRAA